MRLTLSLACLTLALAACKTVPDVPATSPAVPVTTATAPALSDDNLNAVAWVQTSTEYRAITRSVYRAAARELDAALKDTQWNALIEVERVPNSAKLKPAVVVDVDETVLDNSAYQARLVLNGQEYNDLTWAQWVAEKKAKAVPGAVEFAQAAAAKGVTMIYITNRAAHLKDATLANLRAVGLPVANDDVFLGLGTVIEGCEQHGSEKDCRRKQIAKNYRVIMQFGDQLGDFTKIEVNTPAGRAELAAKYDSWFGQRWWVLPGPTYGSWEPALFNNEWRQPRDVRKQAKRAALDPMQ